MSAVGLWEEGVHFLREGDSASAREDLERALSLGAASQGEPSLFFQDLAEVRLFGGDAAGARVAANEAAAALARRSSSAQFKPEDRRLVQSEIDALAAAAAADTIRLEAIAEAPGSPADPWYLLGWLQEQSGDRSAAARSYRGYLDRWPQWALLRSAVVMRSHAQEVARAPR